jgi:hypothetical protein
VKVFLSWSGENSKAIASVLRDWLKLVFPEWILGCQIMIFRLGNVGVTNLTANWKRHSLG